LINEDSLFSWSKDREIVMVKRFGLLALMLFLWTPAHSETGGTLLQACEALERERHGLGMMISYP
jgi:hypothetical protein